MKTLETSRLLLRPFTLEDAEDAYRRRLGFRIELSINPDDPGYVTILDNIREA